MLAAVKFIAREEADGHEKSRKGSKRKHKDRDSAKSKSKHSARKKRARSSDESDGSSSDLSDDSDRKSEDTSVGLKEDAKTRRTDAGLGWMLSAPDRPLGVSAPSEISGDKPSVDAEEDKPHPRELNPSMVSGEDGQGRTSRPSAPGVGDGGASWRLKALKRAQEQAAREGRKLDEIVEERWGSLGELTSSVSSRRSAHANAHLHARRDRVSQREVDSVEGAANDGTTSQTGPSTGPSGDRRREGRLEHQSRMRMPHADTNLSWKSRKKYTGPPVREADAAIIRAAATSINKFSNDGSFFKSFEGGDAGKSEQLRGDALPLEKRGEEGSASEALDVVYEPKTLSRDAKRGLETSRGDDEDPPERRPAIPRGAPAGGGSSAGLSANQVTAKALRLRLAGKATEAEELLKDFEGRAKDGSTHARAAQSRQDTTHGIAVGSGRAQDQLRARNQSFDAEMAGSIARNKSYKGNEEDEYDDFGNGGMETQQVAERGNKKKLAEKRGSHNVRGPVRQLGTQQERCSYCFENQQRPKHLVIAIANFTYLMLPPSASLVPFHCYIVPMQHEGATRNVDEGVWQELRNFKKCLVQMFGDQGKAVLFLETAIGFTKQRRHCFIECIPVPTDVAKDAPLYFKKAIDEVEDEWSQHDAKKLIDTRQRGLRSSIPKNFPYFHVEFGIQGGYCHVIDDEGSFKPQFGRDVIAGMLQMPEEGGRHHRPRDSMEQQTLKVKEFLKHWGPHDWTKMLD